MRDRRQRGEVLLSDSQAAPLFAEFCAGPDPAHDWRGMGTATAGGYPPSGPTEGGSVRGGGPTEGGSARGGGPTEGDAVRGGGPTEGDSVRGGGPTEGDSVRGGGPMAREEQDRAVRPLEQLRGHVPEEQLVGRAGGHAHDQ